MAQLRACLADEAVFILEYANKHNLKSILRYALRRQSWSPFSPEPLEFAPLNFNFHPATVRSWLRGCQFTIERQLTVSHFRMNLFKRLVPQRLLVWLDSLAQLTGDAWQLSPSVFVRSRAVGQTPIAGPDQIFRCPACSFEPLENTPPEIHCPGCGRSYPVVDGIYDFRLEQPE